jgi:hypothetical protein
MKCQACKKEMFISGQEFTSPIDTTDVHCQLVLVCTNPNCTEFGGNDLKNPNKGKAKREKKVKIN